MKGRDKLASCISYCDSNCIIKEPHPMCRWLLNSKLQPGFCQQGM